MSFISYFYTSVTAAEVVKELILGQLVALALRTDFERTVHLLLLLILRTQ